MEQTEGNLFFTFFPHEGYWDDNLKFPFTYETGIRDRAAVEYVKKNVGILRVLEEEVAQVAARLGMTIRNTPFDPSTIGDMVQFVWLYQKGAFMYGFPDGEVLGHDYPKVKYRGVSGHRNVIMMDSILGIEKWNRPIMKKLLQAHVARAITVEAALRFAIWHEARHGVVGNRPDTVMKDGRTMGEVFDWLWGAIAEPGSDFGSFRTALLQNEHRVISREAMEAILYYGIYRAVKQLPRKDVARTRDFMKVGHPGGRTLYVGYSFLRAREGKGEPVLSFDAKQKLVIDFDELVATVNELNDRFVAYGLAGRPRSFLKFYRACIDAIPDEFLATAHHVVGPLNNMPLVDRPGDAMMRLV